MAIYGASLVSLLLWRTLPLHYLGLALFLPFAWFLLPPASAAWQQASESYLFVTKWAWYEWVGIVGPLAGLMACRRWAKSRQLPLIASGAWKLVQFGVFFTLAAVTISSIPRFEPLVRLQPMRSLQPLYLFLFLFVGGIVGQTFRRQWALVGLGAVPRALRRHVLRAAQGIPGQPAHRVAGQGSGQCLAAGLRLDPPQHAYPGVLS